jgi:glutamate formiminotransferase / formiminotetrahydrofolate cyclodeaminase
MTQLVECIPNFSEARRPEVIDQIVAALTSVHQIQLLDRSSDSDHNRSVLTFAGPPQAVKEAAFRAIQKAAELIDMNQHTGGHPRIGATDVVPFVPISGVTMDECVEMAKQLGQRVGAELDIPVYLYENAATRPEHTNLENIRRGQYEGLKAEIETNAERAPDFGPSKLGPAGATVIGARPALIAFNIYLSTDDVSIAKKIAKTVRQSSGGLPYVKALGLLVDGRAQVSMNLTNFKETPISLVVETIRAEARQAGVDIHHSELIGLIPQEALIDTAVSYIHLDSFKPEQMLETHLSADDGRWTTDGGRSSDLQPSNPSMNSPVPAVHRPAVGAGLAQAGQALPTFLDDIAAPNAIPGGGSAAAYSAAIAAGLVSMVAGLTMGKEKYAEVETEMKTIHAKAERLRGELTRAVTDDAHVFEAVMAAFKFLKDTPEHEQARNEAIEQATLNAAKIPLDVARKAVEVMSLAERCVHIGNHNAITDAAAAVSIARAALIAAGYNVRINVDSLQKKANGESFVLEVDALEGRAARINRQTRHILRERGGMKLE